MCDCRVHESEIRKAKDAAAERARRETKARGGIRSDKASKQTHEDERDGEREREQEVGQFATGHSVAKINSSVKKKNRQEEEDEEKREREGHRSRRRVQNKPK